MMQRLDAAWLVVLCALPLAGAAHEAAYRFEAPITIEQAAPFVQLALPPAAYARSQQAALADLRVVDARGERVPFALLMPRVPELQRIEQLRDAVIYPLPPRPATGAVWAAPVEVRVQGDRISVVRAAPGAAAASAAAQPGGWLIDLGERARNDPPPGALRMQWSASAEFTAAFSLEASDDLRSWRGAGGGQLIALAGPGGALTQPNVNLPPTAGRFVRLAWADPTRAPMLSGAKVVAARQQSKMLDPPVELVFAAGDEPKGKTARDEAASRSLHFDLGGALPIASLDLQLPAGTQVVPVRLQGRASSDDAWRELVATVFYRLERGGETSRSPAVELRATSRYVRLVPDPRAPLPDPAQTRLVVQAPLASLVFASQGQPPYRLQAGAGTVPSAALPIGTLVPAVDDERPRFGRAALGAFAEVTEVAKAERARQRVAALRPWLLWGVLVVGVGALGYMVWRLARAR